MLINNQLFTINARKKIVFNVIYKFFTNTLKKKLYFCIHPDYFQTAIWKIIRQNFSK